MNRLLVLAGYLTGAIALLAGGDKPAPVSGAHKALPLEFTYAAADATTQGAESSVVTTGPVVEMTPFRVEEMRPRHVQELERKWDQRERLRPMALAVKSLGPARFLAFETPSLYEAPTPSSSDEVGRVMLAVPLGSLHW